MFKPLAMKYVELSLLKDDAAQAALLLANYGAFDPEIIEDAADQLPVRCHVAMRKARAVYALRIFKRRDGLAPRGHRRGAQRAVRLS